MKQKEKRMLKWIRLIIGLKITRQIFSTVKRRTDFSEKHLHYIMIDSFSDYSTSAVIGYTNQLFVLTAPNRLEHLSPCFEKPNKSFIYRFDSSNICLSDLKLLTGGVFDRSSRLSLSIKPWRSVLPPVTMTLPNSPCKRNHKDWKRSVQDHRSLVILWFFQTSIFTSPYDL